MMAHALFQLIVLSLPAAYQYKEIFVMIIGIVIAINLVLNHKLSTKYKIV